MNTINSTPVTTGNNLSYNANSSYVSKLKSNSQSSPITQFNHLTEEQGIFFDCYLEFTLEEYIDAREILIGGKKNIIAAAKISNNQMSFFLASKEIVENFME